MPKTRFVYEIRPTPNAPLETGEIEAADEAEAKRRLRGQFGLSRLPGGTTLTLKSEVEARAAQARSTKLRQLLHVLAEHHEWLQGKGAGQRANLTRLNLSGLDLRRKTLAHADLAEVDLSGADLSGSDLAGANLLRADLRGAVLRNADLSGADLSEADLREAVLIGAKFDNADLWRTNLRGCVIAPKALHAALQCRTK